MADKTSWRDTYKPARLGPVDARAAFVLLPAMMHISKWTLGAAFLTIGFLYYVEMRRQLTVASAMRMIRCWLVTSFSSASRPARSLHKVPYAIDYDRIED